MLSTLRKVFLLIHNLIFFSLFGARSQVRHGVSRNQWPSLHSEGPAVWLLPSLPKGPDMLVFGSHGGCRYAQWGVQERLGLSAHMLAVGFGARYLIVLTLFSYV